MVFDSRVTRLQQAELLLMTGWRLNWSEAQIDFPWKRSMIIACYEVTWSSTGLVSTCDRWLVRGKLETKNPSVNGLAKNKSAKISQMSDMRHLCLRHLTVQQRARGRWRSWWCKRKKGRNQDNSFCWPAGRSDFGIKPIAWSITFVIINWEMNMDWPSKKSIHRPWVINRTKTLDSKWRPSMRSCCEMAVFCLHPLSRLATRDKF